VIATNYINRFLRYKERIESYWELFSVSKVNHFELNQKGFPTKLTHIPNHLFFIQKGSNKKVAVDYEGLLSKDTYIADKQAFLMQIFQVEKDIQRAKYIYYNWD